MQEDLLFVYFLSQEAAASLLRALSRRAVRSLCGVWREAVPELSEAEALVLLAADADLRRGVRGGIRRAVLDFPLSQFDFAGAETSPPLCERVSCGVCAPPELYSGEAGEREGAHLARAFCLKAERAHCAALRAEQPAYTWERYCLDLAARRDLQAAVLAAMRRGLARIDFGALWRSAAAQALFGTEEQQRKWEDFSQ